jgi:hypothetical protein
MSLGGGLRETPEGLAHAVNDLLSLYISAHNRIFDHPWWQSIPIPGLFKPIDCEEADVEIRIVHKHLMEAARAISEDNSTQPEERKFVDALGSFTNALLEAVSALSVIAKRLKEKSDGGGYSLFEYKIDVRNYRKTEQAYHALGPHMNQCWREYKSVLDQRYEEER